MDREIDRYIDRQTLKSEQVSENEKEIKIERKGIKKERERN